MTLNEALRGHAFVDGLPESLLAKLAPLAEEVSFSEDELILLAGQRSRHFYLLLSGTVCVEARTRTCTVCVQVLHPGEAFGWSALLNHHDTLFQVRARERSRALRLDGDRLSAVMHQDSELAAEMLRRVLELVAGRVQATEARLAEFCGMRPFTPTPGGA